MSTPAETRPRFGSLGSIGLLLVLSWVAVVASWPLNDNSFFTHLATGRLILDEGRVPDADPYTFTAAGEPWTVQSWLASMAMAGAERMGGDVGLRTLVLLVFVATGGILWRLSRPAQSFLVRMVLVSAALLTSGLWAERPFMVGILGLGIVWLALEGAVQPWLLVPLLWIWANTHGSFPLALALVVLVVAGSALDRRALGEPWAITQRERRVGAAVLLGVLVAVVGPLGVDLLRFPFTAFARSSVFAEIIEWQPPAYQSMSQRAFLVLFAATVLLVARRRSWALALPAVAFGFAGVYALRNVAPATVVLVAVSARCAPPVGTLRSSTRPAMALPAAAILAVLFLALALNAVAQPVLPSGSLGGYPAQAIAFADSRELGERRTGTILAAGNLLEVLDGAQQDVFFDDRVDMFPIEVTRDYLRLANGDVGWDAVADRYDLDVLIWDRRSPTASLVAAAPHWRVVYSDDRAIVACRRTACGEIRTPG